MLGQAQTVVTSVTVILGFLAIVAVGLRIYCRSFQNAKIGSDDYVIIVALFVSTGIAILTDYVACTTGVGDPSYEPSLDAVIFALKANFALENFQVAGMALVKISLLLYYSRIFVSRSFIITANILIGVATAFSLSVILVNIFDKWPVHEQWDPMKPYTLNVSTLLISFTAGNALLDILTLCLPLLTIRNLQMNSGRKLILSVIFSFGSVTIIVTILRLSFSVEYSKKPETGNSFFEVPFIYNILMALIELPVFIIVTCLLTLGPLLRSKYGPGSVFRSLRSRLLSNRSRSRKETGKSSTASTDLPNSTTNSKWHPWRRLNEPTPAASNDNLENAEWELSKISMVEAHERTSEA
ncbi:hypothetical protein G7Y89_g15584 [Cudoniella acicularis]|uniref:Rhodopsin domain-containing protein n=1 Tax=Cudoniella acicularis TaxID=354080 RepID=A0A8H4QKW3_9HELO|nr:hypothetical protein G7Y89_g15584 [Cudoniella acicularis]